MKVILIDSGTSNSRIRLVDGSRNKLIDLVKTQVGVRNTAIDGNNKTLKEHLKSGIQQILKANALSPNNISYIVASGMITSNLGVYEVPHINGPVSLKDFVANSKVIELEELFSIPCIFVPGMKNQVSETEESTLTINNFDVMRGEEVEAIGLLKQLHVKGEGIMVLPGSHTKYVAVDEHKRLSSCLSTLGGEVLQAIQKETILSSSLSDKLIENIDFDMLVKGYEATEKFGLTRSLYHIRLHQLFSEYDENARANYFVGAVIHDDIKALLSFVNTDEIKWVVVGGSNQLKKVFMYLLDHLNFDWKIIEASGEQVENSMVIGAQEIASEYVSSDLRSESV